LITNVCQRGPLDTSDLAGGLIRAPIRQWTHRMRTRSSNPPVRILVRVDVIGVSPIGCDGTEALSLWLGGLLL
jgi:hypothetical protein